MSEIIYFGAATPDGTVTPEQWREFLDTEVAPRLRAGFTTWSAEGRWRGADGRVIREDTRVLSVVHEPGAVAEGPMREIVADYKRRFRQEAVLRVRNPACGTF